MTSTGKLIRRAVVAALAVCLWSPARASEFELIYQGAFNSKDALNAASAGTPSYFTGNTSFTAVAFFDTNTPNLVAGISPGFVAYSPISMTITVGGSTYSVQSYDANPPNGIAVAIFDGTTPFGPPGHYAAGFIQNPVADGAGFVGDWVTASPTFSASHLVPTTFTKYFGVGYGSGITPPGSNTPLVTPLVLTNSTGQLWALTLGNYDETFGKTPGAVENFAQLRFVPEPGSALLGGCGLLLLAGCTWRRQATSGNRNV